MTNAEFHALIQAVCPIFGVDSNGNISFDPSATTTQQQQAQSVVAANLPKLNGQPSRLPQTPLQIYNWMNANLTTAQKNSAVLGTVAYILSKDPAFAAQLAAAIGVTIPSDQANPNG